jgi:predicted GIY-YIG superfamily endonuclease|tara:strand:+ start:164 stop:346 length:183 start_codon:yes stop_codon:yes gene_type:complete
MDKKYVGQAVVLPHVTVEKLTAVQKALQAETGINKLSKRQIIEFLASYWVKNNQGSESLN